MDHSKTFLCFITENFAVNFIREEKRHQIVLLNTSSKHMFFHVFTIRHDFQRNSFPSSFCFPLFQFLTNTCWLLDFQLV